MDGLKALGLVGLLAWGMSSPAPAYDGNPVNGTVRLEVAPGLKFSPPRIVVLPGQEVTIIFHNPDEMAHNLVITKPGARLEVVNAALALGGDGPARNFVPPSDKVLWATKLLASGQTATLKFTAPQEQGVYPYVCTFPGHGFIMYGALYVTTGPVPKAEADPNLPPLAAAVADEADHSRDIPDQPLVCRTFMMDTGPASIAVGLPGGQSYVFDTDAGQLRYAWKGGFVDNFDQWMGKGDLWSKVVGRVYYRAPDVPPLRIADPNRKPKIRWIGYRLLEGYPQMRYTVDGVNVREVAHPLLGASGMEFTYDIASPRNPVYFVTDPERGAAFSSSAGSWEKGVLTLSPEQARHFTLTMTERPGVEPISYWSMDDAIGQAGRRDPKPGVVGRAFTPGGLQGRRIFVLDTGISTSEIKPAGTLLAWVKLDPPKGGGAPPAGQPVFSAGEGKDAFIVPAAARDTQWHLQAVVFRGRRATLSLDGEDRGDAGLSLPSADGNLLIGTVGNKAILRGLLDEVRIFNRALSPGEIRKIYQQDKSAPKVLQKSE